MLSQNATGATQPQSTNTLLRIDSLSVDTTSRTHPYNAVRNLSLSLAKGEALALVGESGSGKSLTANAVAGLLPPTLKATGAVEFEGQQILGLPWSARRNLAGRRIGFIFQDPMSSLHPILTVGQQIGEGLRAHFDYSAKERTDRIRELLELVGLSKTREILSNRIDQLSGGMRQRVMIAMAISCDPVLLIADEPTTALDVTLQRQITDLLARLRDQMGLALLLITHDLGVVAETCDTAAVMYAGELVELGPTAQVLADPRHDYTTALLTSIPRLGDTRRRLPTIATTAPWLSDTRQLPPAQRPQTSWDQITPGRWLRRNPEGTGS